LIRFVLAIIGLTLFRLSRSIYVIIGCVARKDAAHWGADSCGIER
jgi:hypothetical protein